MKEQSQSTHNCRKRGCPSKHSVQIYRSIWAYRTKSAEGPWVICCWNPQSTCSDPDARPKRCWHFSRQHSNYPLIQMPLSVWEPDFQQEYFQSRVTDFLQCWASQTQLRTGCTCPSAHTLRAWMLSLKPWDFFLPLHWALSLTHPSCVS